MASTLRWQFFATPSETLEVLGDFLESSKLLVFEQLQLPGVLVRPIPDVSVFAERPPEVHRLFLTAQPPSPGPEPGILDAGSLQGLIEVAVPFVADGSLFLGSISSKIQEARSVEAASAR